MIGTVVLATDGSASVQRAVGVALDFTVRFDAALHVLFVVDEGDVAGAPAAMQAEYREALRDRGDEAIAAVVEKTDRDVTSAIRSGRPADEIRAYAQAVEADVVVMGTRGRHGEHQYLLGRVAEQVVRTCPVPVLTVRQLQAA